MKTLYSAVSGNKDCDYTDTQKKALRKAIESLPEDQQKVLHLYFTCQLPTKEIALQLNCSLSTTYTKLNRAILTLRHQFNPSAFDKVYRILYPETGKPAHLLTDV